jgi:hypothetical protein
MNTTTPQISIFDGYGRIRDLSGTADVAVIETLPDDVRDKMFACIAAVKASEAGEARVVAARVAVREKEVVHSAALEAEHKANPAQTHKESLAAVSAAQRPDYKPEPVKINKKTRAALAQADMALAEARSELTRATTEHRVLVATAGEKLNAWRLCLTTPSDFEVRRQYVERSTQDRAARVAAGLSAEPPKIQPAHQSELDKQFAARGKVQNRMPVYHGKH